MYKLSNSAFMCLGHWSTTNQGVCPKTTVKGLVYSIWFLKGVLDFTLFSKNISKFQNAYNAYYAGKTIPKHDKHITMEVQIVYRLFLVNLPTAST